MPEGMLEVELIQAHQLKDVLHFGRSSDPYALLSCGDIPKQRSRTILDGGSNPVWNQTFLFEIPDGISELDIALHDQQRLGKADPIGTLVIPLATVYTERQTRPAKHKVQLPDGSVHGEVELSLSFFPKKVYHGRLEVHLYRGYALPSGSFWDKSDPYAMIYCDNLVKKSCVINNGGSDPTWDEALVFDCHSNVMEIYVKLFEHNIFKADDLLGSLTIPLHEVFAAGSMQPSRYKISGKIDQLQGEIEVSLKFEVKT